MNRLVRLYTKIRTLVPDRVRQALDDDRGITTETAIITAVLAGLAIGVTTLIVARATGWAESIPSVGG